MNDFFLQNKRNMTKQKTGKLKYRSPEELRADHPDIDFDLIVTKPNHKDLIAVYHYGSKHQKEKCQLLKKQEMCNQPHLNGWIALNKTGAKGLIGRDCATGHFHADEHDPEFQLQINRLDKQVRIEEAQQTLRAARERWTAESINSLRDDLETLKYQVTTVLDCLPSEIKADLKDRAKTGLAAVEIKIQIPEKDEYGNLTYKYLTVNHASISGLRTINAFPSFAEIQKTEIAFESLGGTCIDSEKLPELKAAAAVLNELDQLPEKIKDSKRQLQLFSTSPNLKLLSVLTRNHVLKIDLFESLLRLFGTEYFGSETAQSLWSRVDRDIRNDHGGHDWRLP